MSIRKKDWHPHQERPSGPNIISGVYSHPRSWIIIFLMWWNILCIFPKKSASRKSHREGEKDSTQEPRSYRRPLRIGITYWAQISLVPTFAWDTVVIGRHTRECWKIIQCFLATTPNCSDVERFERYFQSEISPSRHPGSY